MSSTPVKSEGHLDIVLQILSLLSYFTCINLLCAWNSDKLSRDIFCPQRYIT